MPIRWYLADEAYQGLMELVQHFSQDDAAYMAAPREWLCPRLQRLRPSCALCRMVE